MTCTTIHRFCARLVDDAERDGIITQTYPAAQWFDRPVLRALEACEAGHDARFDAVLIDEGQDFTLYWWNMLRTHVVTIDGEMLLVAEPTQDVDDKRVWTDEEQVLGAGFSGEWTDLRGSYRMPGDLVEIANQFAERSVDGERLGGAVPDVGADTGHVHQRITFTNTSHSPTHHVPFAAGQVSGSDELGVEVDRAVVRLLAHKPHLAPNDVAFLLERHRGDFAIAAPGATVDGDELTDWCRDRLAGYRRPKQYEIVGDPPKTATGKIWRYELRQA